MPWDFYNDRGSFLEDLLGKDGSVTIHTRNLQALATEVFKVHKNMSRELIQGLLLCKTNSLWFEKSPSFCYLKYKFCLKLVPDRLKELNSTSSLKNEIKKWQPEICPCELCKSYIPRLGFCNSLQVIWHDFHFQCLLVRTSRALQSYFILALLIMITCRLLQKL